MEYGNVYLAVINCNADLNAAAQWLIEDAAKTSCEWKVVSVHQPAYYTNPKGSSAAYQRILPAAIDQAGIDFVFSGHDHAYARTEPLTNGEVNEDGAVYFICGDLGEKSRDVNYAPEDNPDFHFAKIDQSYDALYLIARTTANTMTVTAYNLDGSVIDSYEKVHNTECDLNGHQYVYQRDTKSLTCSVCGAAAPENYTGWATDSSSGKQMYFLAGEYKTGWFMLGTEVYHFDEKDGTQHKTTVLEDIPTSCSEQGHVTIQCECGETYTAEYEKPSGHSFSEVHAPDGSVYYCCDRCGTISKMNMPFVDVTDEDWFAEAVYYCYQREILRGRDNMTFDPNAPMTRAELVVVLWRLAGSPNSDNVTTSPYVDCPTRLWFTAAINWATENKIVDGIGDNKFAPYDSITREQMVTILYRFAKFNDLDVSKTADLSEFPDADTVSGYAGAPMVWAVAEGIISGTTLSSDGPIVLDPRGTATRGQIAAIIMRYHSMLE